MLGADSGAAFVAAAPSSDFVTSTTTRSGAFKAYGENARFESRSVRVAAFPEKRIFETNGSSNVRSANAGATGDLNVIV